MFWDGTHWIDERSTPPSPAPHRSHRTRDRIATIPIVLLLPALLFPFLTTTASTGPLLSVAGPTTAGSLLPVTGTGFVSAVFVRLSWDGARTPMLTLRTDPSGRLATTIRVPANAVVGDHVLSAAGAAWVWSTVPNGAVALAAHGPAVLASVHVRVNPKGVRAPAPSPTPAPTSAPTAGPDSCPDSRPDGAADSRPDGGPHRRRPSATSRRP